MWWISDHAKDEESSASPSPVTQRKWPAQPVKHAEDVNHMNLLYSMYFQVSQIYKHYPKPRSKNQVVPRSCLRRLTQIPKIRRRPRTSRHNTRVSFPRRFYKPRHLEVHSPTPSSLPEKEKKDPTPPHITTLPLSSGASTTAWSPSLPGLDPSLPLPDALSGWLATCPSTFPRSRS